MKSENRNRAVLVIALLSLATALVAATPEMPPMPDAMMPPLETNWTVTVAWNACAGAAGYRIYYGTNSGRYTAKVDCGPATTLTVSNLVAGVTNYLAATCYDGNGLESGFSKELAYFPVAGPPPVTVVTLTLLSGSSVGGPWTNVAVILGPLTNPAGTRFFKIGVSNALY